MGSIEFWCQRRSFPFLWLQNIFTDRSCSYLRQLEARAGDRPASGATQPSPTTPLQSSASAGGRVGFASGSSAELTPFPNISGAGPSPAPTPSDAPSIWTSPFSLPSTTIKNTKGNKRSWSRKSTLMLASLINHVCSLAGAFLHVVLHHSIDDPHDGETIF